MSVSALAPSAAPLVFTFAMVYAGLTDLTTMKIRNGLVMLLLVSYAGLAPLAGFAASDIAWSAGVGAAVLAFFFALFAFGWIGGGDAKLFAAAALWFGWEQLLDYGLAAGLIGGALTIAILLARRMPLPPILGRQSWILRLHDPKTGVPYGIALAAAALALYPHTVWFAQAIRG